MIILSLNVLEILTKARATMHHIAEAKPVAAIKKHMHLHRHPDVPAEIAAVANQSEKSFRAVTNAFSTAARPGDDDIDNLSRAERAQAEDAELRKLFHLPDSEVRCRRPVPPLLLFFTNKLLISWPGCASASCQKSERVH